MEAVMRRLKEFTPKNRDGTAVSKVWQKESFDYIIRSPEQLGRIRQYIRDNPKAGGKAGD